MHVFRVSAQSGPSAPSNTVSTSLMSGNHRPIDLTLGDGRGDEADADVVRTMGTDCAVGKRTTTFELYRAATEAGLDAGWVATGQTGILVGADRGVVIDRVPADFVSGVVEDMVLDVARDHDIVFVEGQAALTHTAYGGVTLGLLHGAAPDAVVLADDPSRKPVTSVEPRGGRRGRHT
ncbi:hypothetical protein C8039_01195 [Halogeometricum sp. wsp3]|nr:hypothetical protein C8039_01195 [Halogeometricum sp. wsp3]